MDNLAALLALAQRVWHERWMRWVVPVATFAAMTFLATGGGRNIPTLSNLAGAGVASVLLTFAWVVSNRVPRVPRGKVGIVVAISSDAEEEDRQVRADFISCLRALLDPDKSSTHFHLLSLPPHLCAVCVTHDEATRLLHACRGRFMIYGTVRRRMIRSRSAHILALEGVVLHAPVEQAIKDAIQADFRRALPRRVHFPVDNDAFAFEATSEWTDVAARYVIGLAALVSNDVWYAEKLLLSAEDRLSRTAPRFAPLQDIVAKLPGRFEALYHRWLAALYGSYFMTRRGEFVEQAEPVAAKLLARNPRHYPALLWTAICHFVLRRDVAAAKAALMRCRMVRDSTWRYSLAFLLAYEGQASRAREEYRHAFAGRTEDVTVPIQTEEFMQIVLEEEPHRIQLHFFSGLVNLRAKADHAGARRDFERFLSLQKPGMFDDEAVLARQYLREIAQTASSDQTA